MYDYELILINETYVEDDIGNQIPGETETSILCKLKSITRNEFYNAVASGLRPELTFVIHKFEYDGQKKVKFEGNKYNVIRTYATGIEELELTCERVMANA